VGRLEKIGKGGEMKRTRNSGIIEKPDGTSRGRFKRIANSEFKTRKCQFAILRSSPHRFFMPFSRQFKRRGERQVGTRKPIPCQAWHAGYPDQQDQRPQEPD
jgi:hypothetical protein